METSSSFLLQGSSALQKLLDQNYSAPDTGYHSAGGSLSPTSSIDSCGFSPPAYSYEAIVEAPQIFQFSHILFQQNSQVKQPKRTGRPRSKFPGVKRQTASEREKLRMRDLTKALHHLRSFLPPSVAPQSKVLTKIETLRLTIQYISCLSAQLELSEDERSSGIQDDPSTFGHFSPAASVSQSLEAMVFDQSQNPDDGEIPSFPAQDFWISQQHPFFHGHC